MIRTAISPRLAMRILVKGTQIFHFKFRAPRGKFPTRDGRLRRFGRRRRRYRAQGYNERGEFFFGHFIVKSGGIMPTAWYPASTKWTSAVIADERSEAR